MADEPRRSGRATKGQHKHASPLPVPAPKPTKAAAKGKQTENAQEQEQESDGEDEEIRCVCGNTNPKDKRAFIGCDACTVWQHNVCMGVTDDEDDVPEHYFCEQCRPEEHQETLHAMVRGEKIWEVRNKIYQNEKKMSKNRKGKTNAQPGWLKKDVPPLEPPEPAGADEEEAAPEPDAEPSVESTPAPVPVLEQKAEEKEKGSKRKRESIKEEAVETTEVDKPARGGRQDKRRKSSAQAQPAQPPLQTQPTIERKPAVEDSETAIVDIDKLPSDRQKIATALCKIMVESISDMAKTDYRIPDGHTAKSLGEKYATLVEYELQMTHGGPSNPPYMGQFRALNANLKRNKVLVERLLSESLTANELATMESKDMASEELQKERAAMKEELDRQAIAVQEEGPRYRRTHKGDELIEDENQHLNNSGSVAPEPVRERMSIAEGAEDESKGSPPAGADVQHDVVGSPTQTDAAPLQISTNRPTPGSNRRQSSQNFDMSNIWAKTAGSPTIPSGSRSLQSGAHRRQSSVDMAARDQAVGIKHDADVDRMLQDDDEPYNPGDPSGQDIVWRGKLVQTSDGAEPTVNARWVAGRDITSTVPWRALMPGHLAIDGRLQIPKAEEYLCSLQWSSSSDVSVLALSPANESDAETFNAVFQYFKSRERYAVVNKDKPAMVRDMYIIPVEAGAELPEHINMLEHCSIKSPAEERVLLASLVLARAPGTPPVAHQQETDTSTAVIQSTNGQFHAHLPHQQPQPKQMQFQHPQQHILRAASSAGLAGSPVAPQSSTFPPLSNHNSNNSNHTTPIMTRGGFSSGIPPNPYASPSNTASTAIHPPPPSLSATTPSAPLVIQASDNPLVAEILGTLQFAPTTQQILAADPAITREKLVNLKDIMESNPETRTDIHALGRKLLADPTIS